LVKTHDLGISFLPGKWEKAWCRLEALAYDRIEMEKIGRRARKLAETQFAREIAVARLLEIIKPNSSPTPADVVDIRIA
jgi:hypothetical protein